MARFRLITWFGLGLGLGLLAILFLTKLMGNINNPPNSIYEGTSLQGKAAPDFRLTDQYGATIALSDFRGKVVVLTFLDSQCKSVCPLTAAQMRLAYQALGDKASSVVFLGVNVNIQAADVGDVAQTTEKWKLNEIPDWRFLTGKPDELEPVWKAYYVGVEAATAPGGDIVHTSGVYVVDQLGRERWYLSGSLTDPASDGPPLSTVLVKRI